MAVSQDERTTIPRREMPRHIASVQASCHGEQADFVGTIVNISITGAMMMGCQPIAPQTVLKLNIPEIGEVLATVVWNNGEALGLSFTGNSSENIEIALSRKVNALPEQADRRHLSQYTQPTMN